MAGGAPFAEEDERLAQLITNLLFMLGKPFGQPRELASVGCRQILTSILYQQRPVVGQRKPDVSAIDFFLDQYFARNKSTRI